MHHHLGGGVSVRAIVRKMQFGPDLDDLDLGEVSRGLQVCGIARLVKAVANDANRLIFTRRPGAAQILEAGDQLGDLLEPAASDIMSTPAKDTSTAGHARCRKGAG